MIEMLLNNIKKMRKQVHSFSISDEAYEKLKAYAFRNCWTNSFSLDKILCGLSEDLLIPKKKIPSGPYVDTPEDIAEMKRWEKKAKTKEEKEEDREFEKSLKMSL